MLNKMSVVSSIFVIGKVEYRLHLQVVAKTLQQASQVQVKIHSVLAPYQKSSVLQSWFCKPTTS